MKRAVALAYNPDQGNNAPKVVAKGKDSLAYRIIQQAVEHEIPIINDNQLVLILEQLKINDEIPDNLYNAVVEVFVFLIKSRSSQ